MEIFKSFVDDAPLSATSLSRSTVKRLQIAGIDSIGHLRREVSCAGGIDDLIKKHGIGQKTVEAIRNAMASPDPRYIDWAGKWLKHAPVWIRNCWAPNLDTLKPYMKHLSDREAKALEYYWTGNSTLEAVTENLGIPGERNRARRIVAKASYKLLIIMSYELER